MTTTTTLQITDFSRIPNEHIEAMLAMKSAAEIKAMLLILRKTYGWNKPEDRISISQFTKETHMVKSSVLCGIKKLVSQGLIEKISSAGGAIFRPLTGTKVRPQGGTTFRPTKDNLLQKKEIKTTTKEKDTAQEPRQTKENVVVSFEHFNVESEESKATVANKAIKAIFNQLVGNGVNASVANKLVKRYSLPHIEKQMNYLEKRNFRNKAAILVASIQSNYSLPTSAKKREEAIAALEAKAERKQAENTALEAAQNATHIKTKSGRLLPIHSINGDNIVYYSSDEYREARLETRPIHIIMMNEVEFVIVERNDIES